MDLNQNQFAEKGKQQLVKEGAIADALKYVKYKIAVLSGKGGVGKTATTVNLGAALTKAGNSVGIFDADLHGPSIPTMLGIKEEAKLNGAFWIDPVMTESGIKALSVALFWPGEMTPVMWRGQTKSRTIRQLLSGAKWGGLDYLLIDLPPGTGDEAIAILKSIPDLDGVIVVTTPQEVATLVSSKAINASRTLDASVLGLIENMSAYTCACGDTVHLFGKDKGKELARMMEVPFLGSIPIDPLFSKAADSGVPAVNLNPDSITAKAFTRIADTISRQLPPKDVPEAPPEATEKKACPGSGNHHHSSECNHGHHHHHHPHEAGDHSGGCGHHHPHPAGHEQIIS
ncbi:MAG: Mrp/NBP35 family ATP-binding protein [Desulfobacteraceae bacterium]|nr:Mrp/NBP35 family ATP-binding protein [Desulfobacteraceae bacterium]